MNLRMSDDKPRSDKLEDAARALEPDEDQGFGERAGGLVKPEEIPQ
jgi:hypothetical protein